MLFGSIALAMILLALISWLQWLGVLPSPFTREFTTKDVQRVSTVVACPPAGTLQIPASEIEARVLNSTYTGGLANQAAGLLEGAGVNVVEVGNWDAGALGSQGVIEVGPAGYAAGYSLQMLLPGFAVMESDSTDATVTVILGTQFKSIGDTAALTPGEPIKLPDECPGAGSVS